MTGHANNLHKALAGSRRNQSSTKLIDLARELRATVQAERQQRALSREELIQTWVRQRLAKSTQK